MTSVLAIDPGVTGALAAYDGASGILIVEDIPTYTKAKKTRVHLDNLFNQVRRLTFSYGIDHALVEQVGAMPRQGVSSAFNFGFTAGAIHMAVIASGLTVHTVTPQQWKFGVGIAADRDADKAMRKTTSRLLAQKLFPEYAQLFARVKDDGRAEASLMAWWFVHKHPAAS